MQIYLLKSKYVYLRLEWQSRIGLGTFELTGVEEKWIHDPRVMIETVPVLVCQILSRCRHWVKGQMLQTAYVVGYHRSASC